MTRKLSVRILAVAAGLVTVATAVPPAATAAPDFPTTIALPNGFRPEGIAIDPHGTAYTGSLADGDIYAADVRTGTGRVISQGPGTPSVGLKVDQHGRLFVAGGPAGTGRVIDTATGDLIAEYAFTTATSFVNDVALTADAAWFTDSQQPQLYKVAIGPDGRLAEDAVTVPLGGAYQHVPNAFNANGIAPTPDHRGLLVIQSATGTVFRVDPDTGTATEVDLGGAVMTNGDGLLVVGRTLYVVQNRLNKIAVIALHPSGSAGDVVGEITSPGFDVPTTVAAHGPRLYLPNARFTTPPTPDTAYWITAVDR